MRIDPSFWFSLFFVAVIGTAVATSNQWDWDTRLFPLVVGIPALFMAVCQVVVALTSSQESDRSNGAPTTQILDIPMDKSIPREVVTRRTAIALAWIFSFVLSIWLVGFLIGAALFVFFYLWYEANARMRVSAIIASLTALFIWGLFDQVMHTAWPEAIIFRLLGFY